MDKEEVLLQRKNKFLSIGRNKGFISTNELSNKLSMKTSYLNTFKKNLSKYKIHTLISLIILILAFSLFFL